MKTRAEEPTRPSPRPGRRRPSPAARGPRHSLDRPPLPFHQVLDASLKNRKEKKGWGGGGEDAGRAQAAARGRPRTRLAGPPRPEVPRTWHQRPAEAHLADPPLDDGFGREDPLAHCRQLHLAQRHPQPIILPAPAAGAAPLAHAPQRTGPGGARARVPAAGRHVTGPARAPLPGPPPPPGRLLGKVSARGAGARVGS